MKQPLYFCSQAKTGFFFASVFDANLITLHMSIAAAGHLHVSKIVCTAILLAMYQKVKLG